MEFIFIAWYVWLSLVALFLILVLWKYYKWIGIRRLIRITKLFVTWVQDDGGKG